MIVREKQPAQHQTIRQESRLPCLHGPRYLLGRLGLRFRPVWKVARRFAGWLEFEAFPAAGEARARRLILRVRGDGSIRLDPSRQLAGDAEPSFTDAMPLCEFFRALGIDRLELDPRLESNQVLDVMTLLHTYRRCWNRPAAPGRETSICQSLREGFYFACAATRLADGLLSIEYSYCMTRFSRIVTSFERRYSHFRDHRALFHAAPRYGLLVAAIAVAIYLVDTFVGGWVLHLAVTVVGAAILFALVYMFFMVVGSVQYDKEEQAHELRAAHRELELYAERVRNDLDRARKVQRNLLPDPEKMPLPGRLQWAGSFIPETEVGGDYFDAADLGDGRVAVLFADVSGHGMAAAFITALLKASFQDWCDHGWAPEDFVRRANRNLERLTPDDSFAAVVAAVYDDTTHELTYINCGHNPEPYLIPADVDAPVSHLGGGTMLLGVLPEISIDVQRRTLSPGDKVLMTTDGLMEARCGDDDVYGRDQIEEQIAAHRAAPVREMVAAVVADVNNWCDKAEQSDDRTVLAFEVL